MCFYFIQGSNKLCSLTATRQLKALDRSFSYSCFLSESVYNPVYSQCSGNLWCACQSFSFFAPGLVGFSHLETHTLQFLEICFVIHFIISSPLFWVLSGTTITEYWTSQSNPLVAHVFAHVCSFSLLLESVVFLALRLWDLRSADTPFMHQLFKDHFDFFTFTLCRQ